MTKCLNCGAEISQTPGRRPRKFCDNKGKCRLAHWNKNKPKVQKYVLKSTFDNAVAKYENIISKIDPKAGDMQEANKVLHDAVLEYANGAMEGELVPKRFVDLAKGLSNPKHPLYKEGDPKEGSMAFYMKYDCYTYEERK